MTAGRSFHHIFGVDFSGAHKAGDNTWIARHLRYRREGRMFV